MATLASVNFNTLAASLALAERQVQRDQSQVRDDSARLVQSQAQLVGDQRQLSAAQDQNRQSQAPAAGTPEAPKAQFNAQGQTIGKLINIVA